MATTTRVGLLGTAILAVSATTLSSVPPGTATPTAGSSPSATSFQGEGAHSGDVDRRGSLGSSVSTAKARTGLRSFGAAAASLNHLGTPSVLLAEPGAPLAEGLPAAPLAAAKAFLSGERAGLGLTARSVESLEHLTTVELGTKGAVVVMRQRFGDLEAGYDGVVAVGVRAGEAFYVSSSLSPDAVAPAPATLEAPAAEAAAALEAGMGELGAGAGSAEVVRTELVAVPMPGEAARAAYQVVLASPDRDQAVTSYVDARSGEVLVREDLVDHADDNPEWEVFPDSPPRSYAGTDTRERWCDTAADGCDEAVGGTAPLAWDVDPATGLPTFTTRGNNAIAVEKLTSNSSSAVGTETATPSPTREYAYPWTNQWYEERCNPATFTSPERADLDAARANLFAMHNRMHDWSYHLGFTEATWNMQADNLGRGGLGGDYEQGNAQAGGISGGPPSFAARNNANQITPPEGIAPITNMYLWQPIAGAFYAPCVDGDYDMSVIAHEYGHAITNRMIAGPDGGLSSPQGMSESWSDLLAIEYLDEHGYAPAGDAATVVGGYVTGDSVAGIRNYNMARSPLNYSNIGYDVTGPQVHADGEIWSAANYAVRQAFVGRYGAGDPALLKSCAHGDTPVSGCPGQRRWMQLVYDSFLLMANSQVSQVDARNALLAADLLRFGGANQDLIWTAFATRGLGQGAASAGFADPDPTPSFASAYAEEGTVVFDPRDDRGRRVRGAQLFVGDFTARTVPVADTDPATPLSDRVAMVAGTYDLVARGPGVGHARLRPVTVRASRTVTPRATMPRNLASTTAGASVEGTGINLTSLIDEDEGTQWAALGQPVAGQRVIVDLAGNRQSVRRVQVSAHLRAQEATNPDNQPQSRFSAVRKFSVWACSIARGNDCDEPEEFRRVFVSPDDAFPARLPRPRAGDLTVRSFAVPRTDATHLMLQVETNQCTGAPAYAGEQDDDDRAVSDCTTGSPQALNVRAAEFQAFAR